MPSYKRHSLEVCDTVNKIESVGKQVCDTVNKIESVGKQKSQQFFNARLVKKTKSIDDTLEKNNLPLFSY